MNVLREIGLKYGTDKVQHGYMEVYSEYFSRFREKEINILEIGVHGGASIRTWREFFPNANVIGIDIEDKTSFFRSLRGRNRFFLADQGDEKHLDFICETIKRETNSGFDIVIDDGSHFQYDMMVSLGNIFPHMNSGGVYIIEDMCRAESLKEGGSRWWGSADENHITTLHPGLALSVSMPKNWLPTGVKDIEHSAERTIERFVKTKEFTSAFLSKQQCGYITENSSLVRFYKALTPPISGTSSIAVLIKK